MTVNGEDVFVIVGLGVSIGDLPQSNAIAGALQPAKALHGCRQCDIPKEFYGDVDHADCHHTRTMASKFNRRQEMEAAPTATERSRLTVRRFCDRGVCWCIC